MSSSYVSFHFLLSILLTTVSLLLPFSSSSSRHLEDRSSEKRIFLQETQVTSRNIFYSPSANNTSVIERIPTASSPFSARPGMHEKDLFISDVAPHYTTISIIERLKCLRTKQCGVMIPGHFRCVEPRNSKLSLYDFRQRLNAILPEISQALQLLDLVIVQNGLTWSVYAKSSHRATQSFLRYYVFQLRTTASTK